MTLRSEVNSIMTLTTWLSNFNWQHQLSTVSMNSQICQALSRKQVWTSNKMQILQGKVFGSTARFQGVATFCIHTLAAIDENTDRVYACNVYHKVSNTVWWISGKWAALSRNNNTDKLNIWHRWHTWQQPLDLSQVCCSDNFGTARQKV